MISAPPLMMRSAAMAIACRPEEQKRLMVIAETSTGNPARSDGDAGYVHPLLGFGRGAAEDHIFDFFGIDLRHALQRALDGDGGQFIGTGSAERAFEGASHGRANGGGDDDFTHGGFQYLTKKSLTQDKSSTQLRCQNIRCSAVSIGILPARRPGVDCCN